MQKKSGSNPQPALIPDPETREFEHTFYIGKFDTSSNFNRERDVGLSTSNNKKVLVVYTKDTNTGDYDIPEKVYNIEEGFVQVRLQLESNGEYSLIVKSVPGSGTATEYHLSSKQGFTLCPKNGVLHFIGADDIRPYADPPCVRVYDLNRDPAFLPIKVGAGEAANIKYVAANNIIFRYPVTV